MTFIFNWKKNSVKNFFPTIFFDCNSISNLIRFPSNTHRAVNIYGTGLHLHPSTSVQQHYRTHVTQLNIYHRSILFVISFISVLFLTYNFSTVGSIRGHPTMFYLSWSWWYFFEAVFKIFEFYLAHSHDTFIIIKVVLLALWQFIF